MLVSGSFRVAPDISRVACVGLQSGLRLAVRTELLPCLLNRVRRGMGSRLDDTRLHWHITGSVLALSSLSSGSYPPTSGSSLAQIYSFHPMRLTLVSNLSCATLSLASEQAY